MAQNNNVEYKIKFVSNADEVTKQVDGFNNALDENKSKVSDLSNTSDIHKKSINATKDALDKQTNALKTNGQSVLDNGGAMGLLNALTGGYAQIVKDSVEAMALFSKSKKVDTAVTEGQTAATVIQGTATNATTVATGGLTGAFRSLTAAMLANPIGLVVAGVVALTAAIGYLIKSYVDEKGAIEKVNKELDSQKFKQDRLAESIERTSQEISGYNTLEIARAKALGLSSGEIDKIILKQAALLESTTFTNAQLARQNQISAEGGVRNSLIVGDEDAIKKAKDILKEQTDIYNKANAEYDNALISGATTRFSIKEKENNESKEREKKAAEDTKKRNDDYRESEFKRLESDYNIKKRLAVENNISLLGVQENYLMEKLKLEQKYGQDITGTLLTQVENKKAIQKEDFDNDISVGAINTSEITTVLISEIEKRNELMRSSAEGNAEAIKFIDDETFNNKLMLLDGISGAASAATGLLGENTVASKGLAVASATIDTYAAIASTLKAHSGVPIPGYAIAQSIAIGIAGLANVKKILSVKVPNAGSGGGGGASSASVSASTPASTTFVSSSNNQLEKTIIGQGDKQIGALTSTPIKAYVTIKDINTGQELDRNNMSSSSLG